MKKIILTVLAVIFLAGCYSEEKERAMAVGRLSVYLSRIDRGDMIEKIKEKYPDLQIGLIYYDHLDDRYKAVDPRKGFEKLGYSDAFNREVYYYVMYRLTQQALKEEHDYVRDELIRTLKLYQKYLKEAEETEKKDREMIQLVLKYGPVGIIIFSLLVGSGIAYLLFSIARKHEIL
ncbi:hypothetical protein [Persephonella sp.]